MHAEGVIYMLELSFVDWLACVRPLARASLPIRSQGWACVYGGGVIASVSAYRHIASTFNGRYTYRNLREGGWGLVCT